MGTTVSAAIPGKQHAWVERVDDWLNPMVVKELRQSVRGRFVPVLLIAYLGFQLLMMMFFLANTAPDRADGGDLLAIFMAVFLFTTMVLIPLGTAFRIAGERAEEGVDLFYITVMKPSRIVVGKFLAGLTIIGVFYAATLPFLSMTFMLRGVDLPSTLAISLLATVTSALALQLIISWAFLPMNRVIRVLMGLAMFFGLMFLMSFTLVSLFELQDQGMGQRLVDGELTIHVSAFLVGVVLVILILQAMATSLLQPVSANGARPVRLLVLLLWGLSFMVALFFHRDAVKVWLVFWTLFLVGSFCVAVAGRETYSNRIRRTIGGFPPKRAVGFLCCSGAANGMVWTLLLSLATPILAILGPLKGEFVLVPASTLAYGFAYAMTGHLLYMRFLKWRMVKGYAWVVPVVLFLMVFALSFIFAFFLHGGNWDDSGNGLIFILTPIALFGSQDIENIAVITSCLWAALLGAVRLPWMIRAWKAFKAPTVVEAQP